ncbi:TetR/AcrR family transcriptional regulator [Comamonas testosteroni]|uniref:TetR/AcrR family transcriptional regulator n=1 Tax=Comamonas testosteroni TaxID=285 RepID=UPI0026F32345|nr:TetR/AcrR family transcriptional regulator [Comamonas testosteroni]WQD42406.1 TetR/AcrR family transcriptional regulator [Comamonas testosteroni]
MNQKKTRPIRADDATQPAPARGRPAGDHDAKRKELLRAAAAVIAQEGYAKASLRTVAQYAGQSTGAVTYYFANKEELIIALLESAFDRFDAMLESVRESGNIRALFRYWLALSKRSTQLHAVSELLAQGRYEPAFAKVIARRYAHYRKTHTEILKAAQERGTVRGDIAAEVLTDQLVAMGDGWMLMYPVEPERFTPQRIRTLIDAVDILITPAPATHTAP